MGAGFVIIIHFVVIFIISCIIAVASGILTYFISNKDKKKRKIFLSIIIPFQSLYSIYILMLIGSILISETKNVDIGIGDYWHIPLSESYQLTIIDVYEQANIEYNGNTIFNEVSHLQLTDNNIYGKSNSNQYFTINLTDNLSQTYLTETELKENENITELELQETQKFYHKRKWEITKTSTILTLIASILLTILGVFTFCRLVLYGWKLGFRKNKTNTNTIYSK